MYKDKEFHDNVLRINILLKAKEVAEILNKSRSEAQVYLRPWSGISSCFNSLEMLFEILLRSLILVN